MQPVTWQAAACPPALRDGQIHVWKLSLAPAAHHRPDWLDANEHARLQAMASAHARADYLAARIALRTILGAYLGVAPPEVALTSAHRGKPSLASGPEFNLSHGGELLLLAVSRLPVGIDVEPLRRVPQRLAIARRVLGDGIAGQLAALPQAEQDQAFLRQWTAMEARQKCHGEGVFGHRVAADAVGSLAFLPDARHLAHLAWPDPQAQPDIRYFAHRPS